MREGRWGWEGADLNIFLPWEEPLHCWTGVPAYSEPEGGGGEVGGGGQCVRAMGGGGVDGGGPGSAGGAVQS